MNAVAAYCSVCRTNVLVSATGECEYGHPRSSLRGIYTAMVDKRTGRPLPPAMEMRHSTSAYPVPPVAPVADAVPHDASAPVAAMHLARVAAPEPALTSPQALLSRLFGAARGRHSASASTFTLIPTQRGKHSPGLRR